MYVNHLLRLQNKTLKHNDNVRIWQQNSEGAHTHAHGITTAILPPTLDSTPGDFNDIYGRLEKYWPGLYFREFIKSWKSQK